MSMKGYFEIIPIPPTGGGEIAGIIILLALFTVLAENVNKKTPQQVVPATSAQRPLVQTIRVNKIENNQTTVNMGVYGPYLKCVHSSNISIQPMEPDEARIRYKNNQFSWHFYNDDQRINNVAHFYLFYHDSPHGRVELLCKGKGWNGEAGFIRFVLLPPYQESF